MGMMNGLWNGLYSRMLTTKWVWNIKGSIIIILVPGWLLASLLLPSISHHVRLEKFPQDWLTWERPVKNGGVRRREVMAEGRNQACKHWHKQLSAWRGGRTMRVSARRNEKEILCNFLLHGCSSPPTKMLLWHENSSRVARGATCPRVLPVSRLLRHSRAGHVDRLPNNSQAHLSSDSGPDMVTARTQSHRGLRLRL